MFIEGMAAEEIIETLRSQLEHKAETGEAYEELHSKLDERGQFLLTGAIDDARECARAKEALEVALVYLRLQAEDPQHHV